MCERVGRRRGCCDWPTGDEERDDTRKCCEGQEVRHSPYMSLETIKNIPRDVSKDVYLMVNTIVCCWDYHLQHVACHALAVIIRSREHAGQDLRVSSAYATAHFTIHAISSFETWTL
jgi:hypothetical protein